MVCISACPDLYINPTKSSHRSSRSTAAREPSRQELIQAVIRHGELSGDVEGPADPRAGNPLRRRPGSRAERGQRRHRLLLQRHQEPGRGRVRGQGLLHAERVPDCRQLVLGLRTRRLRDPGQARDRCLLRARHARDRIFLLHQRDQEGRQLLQSEQDGVAVRGGEEVLRARPAADLVELQLRARREGHRLRRAGEPGRGGAGPRDRVQDGALVLDEQRARGDLPGVRRHHQGYQRRPRVRRQETRPGERARELLQAVLPAARRRPREQPHLLELLLGFMVIMDACFAREE